jgi:predicted nuclease with RNAse H fold
VTHWAGVDVGGRRKGFHVAVIDEDRLIRAGGLKRPRDVVAFLSEVQTRVVAVDSPRTAAPDGARSRACERRLAREVCGIRYTPDRVVLQEGNPYHEWIVHGLELYSALESSRWSVIECFPTASWTRWLGRRGGASRATWTQSGLALLDLDGIPSTTSQDFRDAIAAALTARLHDLAQTEAFDEIEVPLEPFDTSNKLLLVNRRP